MASRTPQPVVPWTGAPHPERRPDHLFGTAGRKRGGERWHSRWTLPPRCSGRPCETPSSAARSGTLAGRSCRGGLPYATIDELVPRHVLTRSTFSQIKDQITANEPQSNRLAGAFGEGSRCTQVTPQRLLSRTTLEPALFVSLGGTALLRKAGETFHCRPSSVTTVTVFLL